MSSKVYACLILASSFAQGSDWNQWRGPNRNGSVPDSPPLLQKLPEAGVPAAWIHRTIPSGFDGGWGSPVVAEGKVYLFSQHRTLKKNMAKPKQKYPWFDPSSRPDVTPEQYAEYERKRRDEDEQIAQAAYEFNEVFYCLDLNTGKVVWERKIPSLYCRFNLSGSPAVVNGKLYVLGSGRMARCLDAKTGATVWETRLPGTFRDESYMSSFAIAEGGAFVFAGRLFALDASTGKILWEGDEKKTRGGDSSPVVWRSQGREWLIANIGGADTVCLDPKTGAEKWRVASMASNSTPVVVGDLLITYGNSRKKGLRCFRMTPEKVEPLWVYQALTDKGSSPVVFGPSVYVQGGNRIACVDLQTGKQRWSTTVDAPDPQYTSPIAGDGKVYYAQGNVFCFAASPEKRLLLVGKIDNEGRLVDEAAVKSKMGLDQSGLDAAEKKKREDAFEKNFAKNVLCNCSSPAIAEGRMILRLNDGLICHDLRDRSATARKASLTQR